MITLNGKKCVVIKVEDEPEFERHKDGYQLTQKLYSESVIIVLDGHDVNGNKLQDVYAEGIDDLSKVVLFI